MQNSLYKEYKCNKCGEIIMRCDYCVDISSDEAPIDIYEGEENQEVICFDDGESHFHDKNCLYSYIDKWSKHGKLEKFNE